MSYILSTLYDFEGGDAVAIYAAGLADTLGLPLRIVYPYIIPVALGEMPMPLLPVEEVRAAADSRLTRICNALKDGFPALSVSTEIAYGTLADVLDDNSTDDLPLLTIIGNEYGKEEEEWLAGDSATILREGRGPVLAIAADAPFKSPRHICLACDAQTLRDGLAVAPLQMLGAKLGFRVTVLHVKNESEESLVFAGSVLQRQLEGAEAGYVEISSGGDVDGAIAAFAEAHGMDWLAIAPHHYGFWAGLFHKSHTTRVLHLAHIPVLALHSSKIS